MGMFSDAIGSITGANDAKRAIRSGMRKQREALERGMKEIRETTARAEDITSAGFGAAKDIFGAGWDDAYNVARKGFGEGFDYLSQATSRLDPIAAMFDPSMANQFSVGGIAENLGQFMDPEGPFADIISERLRSASFAGSGSGLSRSSVRETAASRIPMSEALELNKMLFQQQTMNPALQAMVTQSGIDQAGAGLATQKGAGLAALLTGKAQGLAGLSTEEAENLANIQLGLGTNIANLESGLGAAEAAAGQASAEAGMAGTAMAFDLAGDIAGAFAPVPKPSDRRIKENIKYVGKGINGLNKYNYNYIGNPAKYVGYMAQEVREVSPDSVSDINGVLYVTSPYLPERID